MTDAAVSVVDTYLWSLLPGVRGTDSEAELPDHVAVRFSEDPPPQSSQQAQRSHQGPCFSRTLLLPVLLAVTLFFCLAGRLFVDGSRPSSAASGEVGEVSGSS